jgi:hypothetical protein
VCGYFLFFGVARWSPFSIRYALPLVVAWCAVIAIALSRFPAWVLRVVLIGLVVASLPQLLDNATQPLVPPTVFAGSYLTPYFADRGSSNPPAQEAAAYQTATTVLAQSTCHRAALANWILLEYPMWVALGHDHWPGTLNDSDVHNRSARYGPPNQPCAWLRQVGSRYVTPRNGTVDVQVGDVAVSVDAGDAASIHAVLPSFSSTVAGTRVLPGGGWSLAALGHDPLLGGSGSLYLSSDGARQVQLEFHLVPNVPQPSLAVSGADGRALPTSVDGDVIRVSPDLLRGINRIDLTTSPSAATHSRVLVLTSVTVGPAGA